MKRISINLILLCLTISLSARDKPNIIILLADDLGWADLGYQGSDDIRSPHIDSLAKNGIRFTDGHVSASVCSPSRAGLMTGRYQQRFGHEANSPPPTDGMDLKQVTMADRLQKMGYRTGLIGKWHLGHRQEYHPLRHGFHEWYGAPNCHFKFNQAKGSPNIPVYQNLEMIGRYYAYILTINMWHLFNKCSPHGFILQIL